MNAFQLKMIALLTMVIDHLGILFFEEYTFLRIIGRVSFIIYSFLLVEGYFHTKNINKYLGKLFIWGLISEIPFDWSIYNSFFDFKHQNIFWTLFLSLLSIHLLEKSKRLIDKNLIIISVFLSAFILRVDYSIYGICIPLLFYFFRKKNINLITFVFLFCLLSIGGALLINKYQLFAILGLFPITLYNGEQGKKTDIFFYSFYALHLFIFKLLHYVIYEF